MEIGKEAPLAGMMVKISASLLAPLVPAEPVKGEEVAAVPVAGMGVEEKRELGIETEMGNEM